jgi:hypothetical protein
VKPRLFFEYTSFNSFRAYSLLPCSCHNSSMLCQPEARAIGGAHFLRAGYQHAQSILGL